MNKTYEEITNDFGFKLNNMCEPYCKVCDSGETAFVTIECSCGCHLSRSGRIISTDNPNCGNCGDKHKNI
jgi:hypothetical protein